MIWAAQIFLEIVNSNSNTANTQIYDPIEITKMILVFYASRVNWPFLKYLNLDSKMIIRFIFYYYNYWVILV